MSSRKEEERNEKIIRGLMKLPPNRRCINCNSLGPQYVCTNFWTFVCMTCSGIHREFTHRVKSVSMSKFTSQEVESLQEGGNQRARETFLKDWDPREQRLPDNSNVDKVREFIKSVYVDKKFFASKASGKPPRDTLGVRNNEDETRRASSYHSYSQSPPYDYQYEERRYGKQAPSLTKKPGSDRGMLRFLSTSRLSDHVQEDDRFANDVANTKARVSDFSGTQSPTFQSEIRFSSLSREMSKDNLTEDVQKLKTGSSDTLSPPSSESGKFDGLDLFSAPYAPSESEKFGGLDLFNAPIQTTTSGPSVVDLFDFSANTSQSTNDEKSQPFDSSSLDLFTVMPQPQQQEKSTETVKEKSTDVKNDGWATFDMPWHAQVQQQQPPTKSVTVVPETSTSEGHFGNFHQQPLSMDKSSQWSVDEGFSNHGYGISQNNNNQTWNAFEESNTHFESIYTSKQVQVQDPYLSWGISENMKMKQADVDAGSTSFVSTTPHDIPQADVLERAQSKSRNPFDFPGDDDLEATNMFLDMSSLQSGLPNHNWFPESATAGIGMQIPNIQAQEPVASIGGNPFG